ncbi:MAG: rhomboid family intramembrane serine protease [Nitrososphaerales archaeon]
MIRPAWVLAIMILAGWVIGAIGTSITVCPPPSAFQHCGPATFYLAQNNGYVIYFHFYFQLGSSVFVTNSIEDVAFNALAVLILDRLADPSFNATRYFSIFIASALMGNILTLLEGPYYLSAGASGGIFGLYAAAFSYHWAEEKKIDIPTLGFFLMIFITSSFLFSNVNWLAHVGGSIAGFIAGPLLYYYLRNNLATFGSASQSLPISRLIAGALIAAFFLTVTLQFLFLFS